MRLLLELTRRGDQFAGSVTSTDDQLCVPFIGVLELLAALEELEQRGQRAPAIPATPTEGQP